jgi:hypothetical protein
MAEDKTTATAGQTREASGKKSSSATSMSSEEKTRALVFPGASEVLDKLDRWGRRFDLFEKQLHLNFFAHTSAYLLFRFDILW